MVKLFLTAILAGLALTANIASAENIICVMVFNKPGLDPCLKGLPGFASVVYKKTPDAVICTREYKDEMCKKNKAEFYHALKRGGGKACVLNFLQQVSGNPCSRRDNNYSYVSEPW